MELGSDYSELALLCDIQVAKKTVHPGMRPLPSLRITR
jgi:hypothetical protein